MSDSQHVVLSINIGSSSLKFALFGFSASGDETCLAVGEAVRVGQPDGWLSLRVGDGSRERKAQQFADQDAAIAAAFDALRERTLPEPNAVGHRLVHGGPKHAQPAKVDEALLDSLQKMIPFAPLHLPAELKGIASVTARFPKLAQVACFDTAFHADLPDVAKRLPLPSALFDRGIRRYGFHGLSYEYVVSKLGAAKLGRAVIAHLGSGASLAAVRDGRSVDTTMGLTPTGGIMMGTRTGDLDPGVLIHLLNDGYDTNKLEQTVDHDSGLLGVSETSSDVQTLLQKRVSDPRAARALDQFAYQIRKAIGSFAAALGGIDNLVFTGGIGEHAVAVRADCCENMEWLGVRLDAGRNAASAPLISDDASRCRVHVIATDEERMIARHTHQLTKV